MKYRLKKSELFRACFYMMGRQYQMQPHRKRRIVLLLLFFLLSLILGAAGYWMLLRYVIAVLLLVALVYLVYVVRIYNINARSGSLEDVELVLEGEVLKLHGRTYSKWRTKDIFYVMQKGGLTILVRKFALDRELYLIIPDRVFADGWQREEFLRQLSEQPQAGDDEGCDNPKKPAPLYQCSFSLDRNTLLGGLTAVNRKMLDQKKNFRPGGVLGMILYVTVVVLLVQLIVVREFQTDKLLIGLAVGVIVGIILGLWATGRGSADRQMTQAVNRLMKKKEVRDSLECWSVEFYEDHILLFTVEGADYLDWRDVQGMLELSSFYVFYGEKRGYLFSVPKPENEEERAEFLLFCNRYVPCEMVTEPVLTKRRRVPMAIQVTLCTIAAVVWIGFMLCIGFAVIRVAGFLWNGEWEESYEESYDYEDYEEFVFDPEEHPDYVPIEEQIEVLTELGFDIPEGALDYYQDWMKDSEYGKLYVEGDPYYMILTDMGMPHYDMDTYEFLGYSNQVYWFDFEGWDISTDYIEILEGVQALTGEEVAFVGCNENCDGVDWNKGTGVIRITFWCNGTPYEYDAEVDHDWLDPGFIGFLNEVLEKEGYEKHLYASHDNGQGNLLFYRDEAWAKEFMEKTGLELGLEAQ